MDAREKKEYAKKLLEILKKLVLTLLATRSLGNR